VLVLLPFQFFFLVLWPYLLPSAVLRWSSHGSMLVPKLWFSEARSRLLRLSQPPTRPTGVFFGPSSISRCSPRPCRPSTCQCVTPMHWCVESRALLHHAPFYMPLCDPTHWCVESRTVCLHCACLPLALLCLAIRRSVLLLLLFFFIFFLVFAFGFFVVLCC
jgi:hypothetical protein